MGRNDGGDRLITRQELRLPQPPTLSGNAAQDVQTLLKYTQESNKAVAEFMRSLNTPGTVNIEQAVNVGTALLTLTDGVTAPATIAGYAQIYVDTADGDLKIKYGDGVTKVIVADT